MQYIAIFDGPTELYLYFQDTGKLVRAPAVYRVDANPVLVRELKRLLGNLNRMARNLAERYGLDLDISYCDTFPNTVSHKACNDKIRRICAVQGIPIREMPEPRRSSEDFGHYTKIIPGAFFEIGAGEDCPELHTEGYDFPDAVMATAVELYLDLIK